MQHSQLSFGFTFKEIGMESRGFSHSEAAKVLFLLWENESGPNPTDFHVNT